MASLRGRVTYNGDQPPQVKMVKPRGDGDKLPKEIPTEGWYVNKQSNGVRYALVFLRPTPRGKLPPVPPEADQLPLGKDGKPLEFQELRMPKGQYEPRVICLHPKQGLKIINDGSLNHNVIIERPAQSTLNQTLPPTSSTTITVGRITPSDRFPQTIRQSIYPWMSGYVWKMTHPWAAVTDEDGNFELKHISVPMVGDKLHLWVWHEMLPDKGHFKELGPLELKAGTVTVRDFSLPK